MNEQPVSLLTFPGSAEAPALKAKALVFRDLQSQRLLEQLNRIAPTGASVLLIGETGTGKELAARHIHERSGVKGPFVAVNCAALSESLADAELFGHEAGAYTGASHARAGWFEAANGGTLFLDEIGDMPQHLQQRLLRVLQERQIVRIGSRKPIAVDVRIVAATNVDLEAAVEARQFRRDLYYRLNVASLRLHSLRDRPGDILPLANHFVELYRRRLNLGVAKFTPAAEFALQRHNWPGNIRELENVVHVGLIMSNGGLIDANDLRVPTTTTDSEGALAGLSRELELLLATDRSDVQEVVEQLLIETAFRHCGGNQVRTAKRLGISRNVVRAQLKRFGLLGMDEAEVAGILDEQPASLPPAEAYTPAIPGQRQERTHGNAGRLSGADGEAAERMESTG
jgi:sigma-54-specific transcriptional regulator